MKRVYTKDGGKGIGKASTTIYREDIFKNIQFFLLDFSSNFEREFTRIRVEWIYIYVFYKKHLYKRRFMNGVVNEGNIKITGIPRICVCIYIYTNSSKVRFYVH